MYKEISLSWHRMVLGLRAIAASRVSFLVQLCCVLASNGVIAVFWLTILSGGMSLDGYSARDVLALSSIVATSLGVSCCVFGNLRNLSQTFGNGDLDLLTVYPRSVLLACLGHGVSMVGAGDLLYGLVLLSTLRLSGWQYLLFFGCVLTSSLFFVATHLLFHSVSLRTARGSLLAYSLADAQITMALFPESIFPSSLRVLLYTVLPVQFVSFYPRQVFLREETPFLWICGAAGIVYLSFSVFLFHWGLRRRQVHGG